MSTEVPHTPLAERLRPQEAAHFAGQPHLLAPQQPLARMLAGSAPLHSMILWGPPGCGKTTLARLLAGRGNAQWYQLSAVTGGIKEVRAVIADAETARQREPQRGRVLFIDEVHHFNKTQQDAFLPHVESGLFVFIGATTENPSFEINNALLSRVTVYVLNALPAEALTQVLQRALQHTATRAEDVAAAALLQVADGDARRLLSTLETAVALADGAPLTAAHIGAAAANAPRRFDKGGDAFYDQISALHKSVRGSDADAALYWLCRMLDGGADGRYIARRLIRMASEDIGLADLRALQLALDADAAYRRLGAPEGDLALAQAAVYLAIAPKSDAVYRAFKRTQAHIAKDGSRPVPPHLQNAPTALMRAQGHGRGYRHAHDEPEGYAAGVHYFPEGMPPLRHYRPVPRGVEKKIAERMAYLRRLDAEAAAQEKPQKPPE